MNIYTRCACVKFDYCLLVRCFSFFLSFVFGAYVLPRWLFAGSLLQMDAYFSSWNCDIESVNSLVAGRQQLSSPRQRLCSLGALLGRSRLNDRCCKLVQIPSVGGHNPPEMLYSGDCKTRHPLPPSVVRKVSSSWTPLDPEV